VILSLSYSIGGTAGGNPGDAGHIDETVSL